MFITLTLRGKNFKRDSLRLHNDNKELSKNNALDFFFLVGETNSKLCIRPVTL